MKKCLWVKAGEKMALSMIEQIREAELQAERVEQDAKERADPDPPRGRRKGGRPAERSRRAGGKSRREMLEQAQAEAEAIRAEAQQRAETEAGALSQQAAVRREQAQREAAACLTGVEDLRL